MYADKLQVFKMSSIHNIVAWSHGPHGRHTRPYHRLACQSMGVPKRAYTTDACAYAICIAELTKPIANIEYSIVIGHRY